MMKRFEETSPRRRYDAGSIQTVDYGHREPHIIRPAVAHDGVVVSYEDHFVQEPSAARKNRIQRSVYFLCEGNYARV
jgi:hypothetical protein